MIRSSLWCGGMLALVLRGANAEMPAYPEPHRLSSPVHISGSIAPAQPTPTYLILRQSTGGVAQPTVGQPYAYGWFGVSPRRHTIAHRGYYGGQWRFSGRIAP